MSETISAFLNSDGGVILIGVQTRKNEKDRKKENLEALKDWAPEYTFAHVGISLTTSQVLDIIFSNIVPKPFGVEAAELTIPIGKGSAAVFVVSVAPSSSGAHQSIKTHRYYRRTADGDEPMLDFEIRSVNNRRAGPLLYLSCKVSDIRGAQFEEDWLQSSEDIETVNRDGKRFDRGNLILAVSNYGRGPANIARFDIGIPAPWRIEHQNPFNINTGAHFVVHSGLRYTIGDDVTVFWNPAKCREIPHPFRGKGISGQSVTWYEVIYSGNETPGHPIWPTSDRRILLVIRLESANDTKAIPFSWLLWRAFANDMLEIRGAMLILKDSGKFNAINHEIGDVSWWYHVEDIEKFEELKQRFKVR